MESIRAEGVLNKQLNDIHAGNGTDKILWDYELHYRQLLNGLPVAVYTCDQNGYLTHFNQAAVELFGRVPQPGKDVWCGSWRIFNANGHHVSKEECPMAVAVKEGRTVFDKEMVLERPDGTKRYVKPFPQPIFDSSGKITGGINVVIDVTEEKWSQEALNQSEALYRQLVQGVAGALYTCDAEGRVMLYNQAAVELWGREPEAGKDLWCGSWKIYYPDGRPMPLDECPMAIALKEGRPALGHEIIVERPDGNRVYVAPHPCPFFDSTGKVAGAVNMLVDITGLKQARELLELKVEERTKELKQANQKLLHTNQTFEHAEQIAKFGSYRFNLSTGQISYSDNLFRLIGCEPNEFEPGKTFYDFVHPEDLDLVVQGRNDVMQKRQPSKWEYRLIRKNGEIIYIRGTGKIITDEEGMDWLIGTLQDITEEKKQELKVRDYSTALETKNEELLRQNEFIKTLLNSLQDPIAVIDSELRYILINKKCEEGYKIKNEDVIGRKVEDVFPQIIHSPFFPDLKRALGGEIVLNPILKSPVNNHWYTNYYIPLRRPNGEVYGAIIMGHDCTNIIEASEKVNQANQVLEEKNLELQRQKEFVENIIDASVDLIGVYDTEGRLISFNKKCEELYGLKKEDCKGKTFLEIFPNAEEAYNDLLQSVAKGKPVHRLMYRSPLIGRIFHNFFVPLKNNNEVYAVLAISHDNTDFIEATQKLHEVEQKNKDLEQFAYVASHDLQEPLNTISSFIALMEEELEADNQVAQYLGFIKESTNRLTHLITDLLEHSRIGRNSQARPVDFMNAVQEVIADMNAIVESRKAHVTIGNLPVLKAYPMEIRLLFQNLISNALKFQKEDTIPEISIAAKKTENGWQFTVEDNGIGIEEKYKDRIFIIFQRLYPSHRFEGTGIGLAHCKKIIDLHHGKLWLDSALGKGSKFHFTIPETL